MPKHQASSVDLGSKGTSLAKWETKGSQSEKPGTNLSPRPGSVLRFLSFRSTPKILQAQELSQCNWLQSLNCGLVFQENPPIKIGAVPFVSFKQSPRVPTVLCSLTHAPDSGGFQSEWKHLLKVRFILHVRCGRKRLDTQKINQPREEGLDA